MNLLLMVGGGAIRVDLNDEVIAGCCVTHGGEIRHQPTGELLPTGLTELMPRLHVL